MALSVPRPRPSPTASRRDRLLGLFAKSRCPGSRSWARCHCSVSTTDGTSTVRNRNALARHDASLKYRTRSRRRVVIKRSVRSFIGWQHWRCTPGWSSQWTCRSHPNSKRGWTAWLRKRAAQSTRLRSICWLARPTTTSGSVARWKRVASPPERDGCLPMTRSSAESTSAIRPDARPVDDRGHRRPWADRRVHSARAVTAAIRGRLRSSRARGAGAADTTWRAKMAAGIARVRPQSWPQFGSSRTSDQVQCVRTLEELDAVSLGGTVTTIPFFIS